MKRDSAQYSVPDNEPKGKSHAPKQPDEEEKNTIRGGAKTEDQLDKLKPEGDDDTAPNELGSPPETTANKGE